MSTAVASLPVTGPLAPPSMESATTRSYTTIASSGNTPNMGTPARHSKNTNSHSPPTMHEPHFRRTTSDGKRSPNSGTSSRTPHISKVIVKKEPTSPDLPTGRHRPSRLNLTTSNMSNGAPSGAQTARPSAPLTSRESAGLHLQDFSVACLSPGFNTQDPTMREQLERSMSIREQQRKLIENRARGPGTSMPTQQDSAFTRASAKTPNTSRRKGPPPGLSIAPPSAEKFSNERVIQSAPLHASFPRHHMQPMSRQVLNQSSNLSQGSSIHHNPAIQTNNRLPPIADVLTGDLQGSSSSRNSHYQSPGNSSHSNIQPPLPSPGYPPHTATYAPTHLASRPREHKSAEEALKELTGGREEMLPRIVHYGGHQPPTPPSPKNIGLGVSAPSSEFHRPTMDLHRSGSSRRRDRDEYERDAGSPPLGRGGPTHRKMPFGEGRDSPHSTAQKKDEFMTLVSRAWDLWHS